MIVLWFINEIIIKNVQNAGKIMKNVEVINNINHFVVNKFVDKVHESVRKYMKIKKKLKEYKIEC